MADQKIVTETALSAFASDVKGELLNKIGYDELPTISDNEPYNFRPSANGKDIGDRETDKIIGGSIAFNQLFNKSNYPSSSGIFTNNGDGTFTANGTAETTAALPIEDITSKLVVGHKYFVASGFSSAGSASTYEFMLLRFVQTVGTVLNLNVYTNATIAVCGNASNVQAQLVVRSGNTVTNLKFIPQLIDLTQLFGSTIADFIYNLEQANTGAGVAYFRKLFPKPYYAYNAGELMSVKTSAHVTTGFNQWDEEWELGAYNNNGEKVVNANVIRSKNLFKVLPNTTYYFYCGVNGTTRYVFYDANLNCVYSKSLIARNATFITPSNAYYMAFNLDVNYGTTYNHDICINLSWDGERDGEYEPYEVNTYPLDSNLELRGIPKLDANNNLYYDGDEYTSDGNVKRRFGIVDLGTVNWNKGGSAWYTSGIQSTVKKYASNETPLVVMSRFPYVPKSSNADSGVAGSYELIIDSNGNITYRYPMDAYADATAFKTAMSGVYLVYELATPTTETADTFTNPQIVNDFGTEEYVDERAVAIPVGHETEYVKNMDKLLLPATPSADGTYTLKCTVSGGTPTLSWVADT